MIEQAREQFPHVHVIYVDAAVQVRKARIAARGRDTGEGSRLDPERDLSASQTSDVVIDNSGTLPVAVDAFVASLRALTNDTPATSGTVA